MIEKVKENLEKAVANRDKVQAALEQARAEAQKLRAAAAEARCSRQAREEKHEADSYLAELNGLEPPAPMLPLDQEPPVLAHARATAAAAGLAKQLAEANAEVLQAQLAYSQARESAALAPVREGLTALVPALRALERAITTRPNADEMPQQVYLNGGSGSGFSSIEDLLAGDLIEIRNGRFLISLGGE